MGRINFKCLAPEQDPLFGINPGCIVDRLTRKNWRNRAVCRTDGEVVYYTYVVKGTHDDGESEKRKRAYALYAVAYPDKTHNYGGTIFRELEEALARANGEDGSEFALDTRPADWSEYPRRRSAPIFISSFNRIGSGSVPPPTEGGGNQAES